jgi:hypothetical protein
MREEPVFIAKLSLAHYRVITQLIVIYMRREELVMMTMMGTAASERLPRRKRTRICPYTLLSSDASQCDEFRII